MWQAGDYTILVYKTKKYWRLGFGYFNKKGKHVIDTSVGYPEGKRAAVDKAKRLMNQ
jgi:hypothetical protein